MAKAKSIPFGKRLVCTMDDTFLCHYIDTSDWKNEFEHRSNILYAIIFRRSTKALAKFIESGWNDVNEVIVIDTPLHLAVLKQWKDGVRALLEAGADPNFCKPPGKIFPLVMAIKKYYQPVGNPQHQIKRDDPIDIIKLLLQYGAHVNAGKVPPLFVEISRSTRSDFDTTIIDLLLENGADANVVVTPEQNQMCSALCFTLSRLHVGKTQPDPKRANAGIVIKQNAAIFRNLIKFGADVNRKYVSTGRPLLLHEMAASLRSRFLSEHLDLYFQHGGDIEDSNWETPPALLACVKVDSETNNVRWLMRHGADTRQLQLQHFRLHLLPFSVPPRRFRKKETLLVLLKSGFKLSHILIKTLTNIRLTLQVHIEKGYDLITLMKNLSLYCLDPEESGRIAKTKYRKNKKKSTMPQERTRQMADLLEFSDGSLNVYPENEPNDMPGDQLGYSVMMISKVLDYMAQPRTLQWWCRGCIRESLVSLHPSAVKTLPAPSSLKRYILCHEL